MAKIERTPKRRTPAAKKPNGRTPTVPASVSFDTEAGRRAQGIDTDYRNVDRGRRRRRRGRAG